MSIISVCVTVCDCYFSVHDSVFGSTISVFFVCMISVSVIVRQMIAVTETEKGSVYGSREKDMTTNNNKKLQ